MSMRTETSTDPLQHVRNNRDRLTGAIDDLGRDERMISDPRVRALFETSRETLIGMRKAFDDCLNRTEAWK